MDASEYQRATALFDHHLDLKLTEGLATLTIDRPKALNTLTLEMVAILTELFDRFDRDSGIRAVLLTASGHRAFCAGLDVKTLDNALGRDRISAMPTGGTARNLFEAMIECGKPTLAALPGDAFGAGAELALACDLRIMAPHSRIGFPEARIGMGANFGSQMLARLIPRGLAFHMLYTGEPVPADTAHHWGLVNRIDADVVDAGTALCRTIVANAPLTVRRYKQAVNVGADLPLSTALRLPALPNPYTSADRVEGFDAFVAKRTPHWQAR